MCEKALAIFRKHFSDLLSEPMGTNSYDICLQKIGEDICANLKKERDIETAWDAVAQEIEEGNIEGRWDLEPPDVTVRLEAPLGLRDREFFHNARRLRLYDYELIKGLDNVDFRQFTCDEILGGVLYFSARGGLCQAEALEKIPSVLAGNKPLYMDEKGMVWAELKFQNSHSVTNAYDGEKKWTSRPWFVSSQVMGLVQRYLQFKQSERKAFEIQNRSECLNLIRKFSFKLVKETFPFKDLRELCKHMPAVIEGLEGVRIPEALVCYMNGKTASVPLSKAFRVPCPQKIILRKDRDAQEPENEFIDWQAPDCNFVGLYEQVRKLLDTKSRKVAISGLEGFLKTQDAHPSVYYILQWYIYSLDNKSWVPKTAERYHNAFFNEWLSDVPHFGGPTAMLVFGGQCRPDVATGA
ncbi:hypothetical protein [Terasakiella sp. SH-1]|uniref:hypothetical protein n=1 Tax=Terasakiella sp. SH-1 TaxID=2560057 RepID=UPI00107431A1|nr:hypothetical protein [Terasakiella sp. SH-1]